MALRHSCISIMSLLFLCMTVGHSFAFSVDRADELNYPDKSSYETHDDLEDYAESENDEIQRFLISEEHKELRRALIHALDFLDSETKILNEKSEAEFVPERNSYTNAAMPFYLEHVKSIINGEAAKQRRRSHRKRSSFDSIGHQGGLGGLGNGRQTKKKLSFTFQNLLPYLITEMRRNNRAVRV